MDKNLVTPFINAGSEIFFELLGEKPVPGSASIINKKSDSQGLIILVGITGDLNGRIIIDLTKEQTHIMAEKILHEEIPVEDEELIESAISELGNMLSGRAVSKMSEFDYSLKITPPTLMIGDNMKIVDTVTPILVVPFQTAIGTILLNLSVEKA